MADLKKIDVRALQQLAMKPCIKYEKYQRIDRRWSQKLMRYIFVRLAKKKLCEQTIETIECCSNKKYSTYVYTITQAGREALAAEAVKGELLK